MKWIWVLVLVVFVLSVGGFLVYRNNKQLADAQMQINAAQQQQAQLSDYLANQPAGQSCNVLLDKNCFKTKGLDFSGIFSAIFSAI